MTVAIYHGTTIYCSKVGNSIPVYAFKIKKMSSGKLLLKATRYIIQQLVAVAYDYEQGTLFCIREVNYDFYQYVCRSNSHVVRYDGF